MSKITRLQTDFEKLIAGDKSIEVRAVLGRADGTVKSTTTAENVYVTLYNGNVIEIYNERVPRVPYRKIIIGYDARDPNLLQVLRFDDVYDTRPHPNLPNHKESHTWFGYDPIDVYAQQIMPLLPRSIGALVVRVYGGDYFCNGADHIMNTTDVDLAAEIPASGAEWVDVEIDAAGAISFKHGTVNKASRELLLPEDRPIRTVTKKLLFSAKMYVGLTEFIQTRTDSDIFDPRFTGFGEGGASVAIDWTDVENKPLVFPPDLTLTDPLYPRKWYKSTAPTANDDYSAGYEKADIWIDQSNGNAWVCIENGETACLAGSAVWVMVGGGGSSGSLFQVEGRLAVVANAAQPILITKDTTISAVYVYLENTGTAGSTIIDIYQNNLCFTSIFTNICDNRPEILFSDPNGWVKVVPNVTDFVEGDILFLSIDQVATLAENMLVVLDVSSSGGGGGGALTVTDNVTTVSPVGQITVLGIPLTDQGGGEITLELPDWITNHPDNPPAIPDAMDDEFNGVSLDGKWATIGSGSPTYTVANGLLRIQKAAANERLKGVEQAISGAAWTFRTRCFLNSPTVNFIGIGMFVRDSGSGKIDLFTLMHHTTWGYYAPYIIGLSDSETPNAADAATNAWFISQQYYFELEYNGTNFYFRCSSDGFNYFTLFTRAQATNLGAEPDKIGIGLHAYGPAVDASWDWFRKVA